jgi:hypothetical protein
MAEFAAVQMPPLDTNRNRTKSPDIFTAIMREPTSGLEPLI